MLILRLDFIRANLTLFDFIRFYPSRCKGPGPPPALSETSAPGAISGIPHIAYMGGGGRRLPRFLGNVAYWPKAPDSGKAVSYGRLFRAPLIRIGYETLNITA